MYNKIFYCTSKAFDRYFNATIYINRNRGSVSPPTNYPILKKHLIIFEFKFSFYLDAILQLAR